MRCSGKMPRTGEALVISALLVGGPAQAAVATPVSGAMSLSARASLGPVIDTELSTDSWAGSPADLAVAAGALAVSGDKYALVSGSAAARWFSADQGGISFTGYNWDFETFPTYPYPFNEVSLCGQWCSAGPDWSYTFTANADGGFRMAYDIVGRGDPSLQGWGVGWSGIGGCCDSAVVGADDVHITGTFAYPISAGQTYTVSLDNMAGRWGGLDKGNASMDGVFSWNITTQGVPEPATWAVLLAGLGSVGAAMRLARRKQSAALQ